MMQNQPQSFQQGLADDSKPELTEAQQRFAELVGRELARLWIEQHSGTSRNTEESDAAIPIRTTGIEGKTSRKQ